MSVGLFLYVVGFVVVWVGGWCFFERLGSVRCLFFILSKYRIIIVFIEEYVCIGRFWFDILCIFDFGGINVFVYFLKIWGRE